MVSLDCRVFGWNTESGSLAAGFKIFKAGKLFLWLRCLVSSYAVAYWLCLLQNRFRTLVSSAAALYYSNRESRQPRRLGNIHCHCNFSSHPIRFPLGLPLRHNPTLPILHFNVIRHSNSAALHFLSNHKPAHARCPVCPNCYF